MIMIISLSNIISRVKKIISNLVFSRLPPTLVLTHIKEMIMVILTP